VFVPSLQQRGFEGLVNPNSKTNWNPRVGLGTWTYKKHEGTKRVACCYDTYYYWLAEYHLDLKKRQQQCPPTHTINDSSSCSSTAWLPHLGSGTPFLFLKSISKMSWGVVNQLEVSCHMWGGGSSVWASSKSTHKSPPLTYLGFFCQCLSISIKWCYNYLECSNVHS
jgi:hypothetical protein